MLYANVLRLLKLMSADAVVSEIKQKLQPYLPLSYWLWVIQKQAEERLNQLLPTSRA